MMIIKTLSRAMTILVTLALLFSTSTMSSQAAPAYGATIDRTFTEGNGLVAEWNGINGDILTFVSVTAVDNTTLTPPQPGGPQKTPSLIVSVLQWNLVTGEVYALFSGDTAIFTMSVAEDLSSASAQGAFTAGISNVEVDIVATAVSDAIDQDCRERFVEPGLMVFNLRSSGDHRDAVVTGTVTVNGVNLTPGPSTSGHIHYSKTGALTVQVR